MIKINNLFIIVVIGFLINGCSTRNTEYYDLIIKKEDINMIKNYKINIKTGETDWKVK